VSSVHGFGNYELELASCLLAKGVEAKRAKELIEDTMAKCAFERNVDRANVFALHAFALASNGLPEQAHIRLHDSFADRERFRARDQAFLWITAGATYRAFGERASAHDAFKEAIRIHPFGDARLRAEKWLRLLADDSQPDS